MEILKFKKHIILAWRKTPFCSKKYHSLNIGEHLKLSDFYEKFVDLTRLNLDFS